MALSPHSESVYALQVDRIKARRAEEERLQTQQETQTELEIVDAEVVQPETQPEQENTPQSQETPEKAPEELTRKIEEGDTISDIAAQYRNKDGKVLNPHVLGKYNNDVYTKEGMRTKYASDWIYPGQEIKIPPGYTLTVTEKEIQQTREHRKETWVDPVEPIQDPEQFKQIYEQTKADFIRQLRAQKSEESFDWEKGFIAPAPWFKYLCIEHTNPPGKTLNRITNVTCENLNRNDIRKIAEHLNAEKNEIRAAVETE